MRKFEQEPDYSLNRKFGIVKTGRTGSDVSGYSGTATIIVLTYDSGLTLREGVASSVYIVNSFFRVEYLTYFSGCLACMWYRKLEFSEYESSQ